MGLFESLLRYEKSERSLCSDVARNPRAPPQECTLAKQKNNFSKIQVLLVTNFYGKLVSKCQRIYA